MSNTLIGAIAIFIAMGLMRMTWRNARRERPDGIRWRGIDWSRAEPKNDEEAKGPSSTGDDDPTAGNRSSGP
ncbi:MAG TPA: hypothetical protein VF316_09400 [Polyangiaceae bacterium]